MKELRILKRGSTSSVDHDWDRLYKIGGFCFILIGIWYVFANFWGFIEGIPSPGFATPPVATASQYFNILGSYPTASILFYSGYSAADLLLFPAILALYFALKGVGRNLTLLAMALAGVWGIVDLGVTEFNSLVLVSLAQSYNAATDAATKATYLAASNYALGAIPIATFYSYFIGSVAFLLVSLVMFRGVFRFITAPVGIVANGLGIVVAFVLFDSADLSSLIVPTLMIYGFWNILVGAQLYRLGHRSTLSTPP